MVTLILQFVRSGQQLKIHLPRSVAESVINGESGSAGEWKLLGIATQ